MRLTEGENEGSEELTNISSMIQDLPEDIQEIVNAILRAISQPEESEESGPEITELPDNALEDSAPSGRVQGMADAINNEPGQPGYNAAREIAEQTQQQQQPE